MIESPPKPPSASSRAAARADWPWAALFLAPALFGILLFTGLPTLGSLWLSFNRWDLLGSPEFVGLKNYADLFQDPLFWQVMGQTFAFVGMYLVLDLTLALGLAVALSQPLRGIAIYRTAYFLPVISSMVAVSILWLWIFDPRFGLLNALVGLVGIEPQHWLSDPHLALPALVVVSVWKSLGYDMLLFLAGLQAIPSQYLEAAAVDGADGWARFRHITLPLLGPTLLLVGILATMRAFQTFDAIYLMTQGGPQRSTLVAVYWLFQNGFQYFKLGKASALAYVLFAILLALTALQWYVRKKWIHAEQGQ